MLAQLNFMRSLRRDSGQRKCNRSQHHHDGHRDKQLEKREPSFSHRSLTTPFPSGGPPAATSPSELASATRIGDTPGAFARNLAVTFLAPVDPCGAEAFTRKATKASPTADAAESPGSM